MVETIATRRSRRGVKAQQLAAAHAITHCGDPACCGSLQSIQVEVRERKVRERQRVQAATLDLDTWTRDLLDVGLPVKGPATGHEATWADYYSGAGGSSSGIEEVLGARVALAANHWELAVRTHQFNMPHAEHDIADITGIDPRKHPRTDFAWFSPECTTWSVARGERCDYDGEDGVAVDGYVDDGDDPQRPLSEEAKIRSRVQMRDVVRFSAYHHYRGVIVENVPDILKWKNLDRLLGEMRALGYKHKILTLNSAFAHGLGAPAPQLRDRVFIVFWKAKYRTPNWDKWLRPHAWCPSCNCVVRGIYTAKPGTRRPMRYGKGAQYTYRCPKKACPSGAVQPFVLPAQSAIDLSLPSQRIRDRKRPLAPNTRWRIAAGLRRWHGRGMDIDVPMLVPTGGTWNDDPYLASNPLRTRTTRENEAVVTVPAMTVSTSGRDGSGRARLAHEPFATQTARHEGAVVGVPLYVPLRNNGVAAPAHMVPTKTFAAGGEHHAIVMRNNTARGDAGQMSTPLDDPIRTLTTAGHQSVIGWDGAAIYSYDTGGLRPLSEPLPTQTTVDGDALFEPGVDVDDCTLRMLVVYEIRDGMGFDRSFHLLGTAKRDKVKMLGNAVTPPCARDLTACLMEAVLGVEYELFQFGLALAA